MENGWVLIHRKILDNAIANKPAYAWLWIVLLLKANHADRTFIWNKKKRVCKRGEFITGRAILAKETGIPATTIERILDYFENEHQIGQQKTSKFRLISIKNYDQYQKVGQQNGQQMDNRRTQTKNLNNLKNYINYKDGSIKVLKDGTKAIKRFGKWVDYDNTAIEINLAYYPELQNI